MRSRPASTQCLLDSSHTFEKEGVNKNVDDGDVIKIDANHHAVRAPTERAFCSRKAAIAPGADCVWWSADLITRECCIGVKFKQVCCFSSSDCRSVHDVRDRCRTAANLTTLVRLGKTSTRMYLAVRDPDRREPENQFSGFRLSKPRMLPSRFDGRRRRDRRAARAQRPARCAIGRSVRARRAAVVPGRVRRVSWERRARPAHRGSRLRHRSAGFHRLQPDDARSRSRLAVDRASGRPGARIRSHDARVRRRADRGADRPW